MASLTEETTLKTTVDLNCGRLHNCAKYWTNILDYPPGHISDSTA